MEGIRQAGATALGIRAEVTEDEKEIARILEAEVQRCLALGKKKEYQRCMEGIEACSAAELSSTQELKTCLASGAG